MSGALDNLFGGKSGTTTGSDTTYVNKVFLGSTPVVKGKKVMSPTGTQYTSATTGGDITRTIADAKNVSRITAKAMWDMAVDGASTWYAGSAGTQKVTPDQYLQWYSKGEKGSGTAERLPQKQVYLYDNDAIKGIIDNTLTNVLGRKATSDENKQFFAKLKEMINEGTVTTTTTKVVGGKKMNVSTTTPGFSQEAAAMEIEKQIKAGTPGQKEDYLQKKSLDFADFLSQLGG
jgi:hypothetical protein